MVRSLLCLHGSGGSSAEWAKLNNWAKLARIELSAIDAPSGNGKWWTYPPGQRSFTASSYSGAEESIALVESELRKGGHAGVMGFSQGAMLAAIVAARSALGESGSVPLKCAVLCAAAIPKPYEPLLHRLRDAPDDAKVLFPTLHTLCRADPMNPSSMGEDVASCFEPLADVMWHEDGHAIPPLAAAAADAMGPSSTSMADVAAWLDRVVLEDGS